MADRGVTEELYAHVEDPANGDYSEQELLAIEYADKFALDHRSIDDAFFARLRAAFTDAEIVELTAMIGNWLAFGRFQAVLDVAEACAWAPPAENAQEKVGV
jgi:alkylhydroperoxidase family enzyme